MIRHRPILLIAIASLLVAPLGRAQDRPVIELSLDDAVKRALENNVDIAVEKFNPESSAQAERGAMGYYDPYLSGTLRKTSQTSPATSAFSGGDKVETDTWAYNVGASQYLPTGGNVSLLFNNSKQDTNNSFASFNPTFNSNLNLSLVQPLLKNFKLDYGRQQIKVAKKNRAISEVQYHQTVVTTVANVKSLYYDLIYAIDNLAAARKSLALAQKLLEENRIKVRVGTLAPLDVVSAESEVASREEGVIVAENSLGNAEDALRAAIVARTDAEAWNVRIVPTDRPSAERVPVDPDKAVINAMQKRTDVQAARYAIERADITRQFTKAQKLPQVDLIAAYGSSGVGGDQLIRSEFGGPVIDIIPGSYGDAVSSVFGRDFPTWTLGINVSYSILNRAASASQAQSQLAKEQAEAFYRRLELQVSTEVRSLARAVDNGFKRVQSTQAARTLQAQRLDAEEKKFAAGMSTNFLVTQAQRDLAVAEVAEIQSIADYRKSIINFERAQEAGQGTIGATTLATSLSALAGTTSTAARGANALQQP